MLPSPDAPGGERRAARGQDQDAEEDEEQLGTGEVRRRARPEPLGTDPPSAAAAGEVGEYEDGHGKRRGGDGHEEPEHDA